MYVCLAPCVLAELTHPRRFWRFFGIFYIDNHVICKQKEFSLFLICIPFISSSYANWLKLPALCLIRVMSRRFCFVPDLGRKTLFFSVKYNVSWSLFVHNLYQVEEIPFCCYYFESFYHDWMLNYVKWWLFALICIINIIFFFSLLIWHAILIDFQILNQLFILELNPTWSECIILSIYCWIIS